MHRRSCAIIAAALLAASAQATAATPESLLADFARAAGAAPQAARGQNFFTVKHGGEWSCSNCHTSLPTVTGQHASTGKPIAPLAPAFNPERFTDSAKVEKWFRRNCRDVLGRECTALEKADLLAWLVSIKA
jgi:hypothetical protein